MHHVHPHHPSLRPLVASVAAALVLMQAGPALGGPTPCSFAGSTITCEGDQSGGISLLDQPFTLDVVRIVGPIAPLPGTPGIRFVSRVGGSVFVNSGERGAPFSISTSAEGGIVGFSLGMSAGSATVDPLLGVAEVGLDPAAGGGEVVVRNFSDIVTSGDGAIGIEARSLSPGYTDTVLDPLREFTETGFAFEVVEVRDAADAVVSFVADTATLRGHLIDADGNAVLDGGVPIEYGTFTIDTDGSFTVAYTADDLALQAALGEGESLSGAVAYKVQIARGSESYDDTAKLIVTMTGAASTPPVQSEEAYFTRFGVSGKPALETGATVFPDLQRYVDTLLANATTGGGGNSASVVSDASITTGGEWSHGISAYSRGGQGAAGRGGSISHPADNGQNGSTSGRVSVTADGRIETQGLAAAGIMAIAAGGDGGAGGNGGAWRHGKKGGTGGDGGEVAVRGSAVIITDGDYASGIVALSVGGNGGAGGSGSGAMPGGGGGFGGSGGLVTVDGTWNVTNDGRKAHGIWAKSLGGNAGAGGSGGWLFGDPGNGGTAADGRTATLRSGGVIHTWGAESYGLYAQSVGGFGGTGGTSWGLFWSFGGDANSGGSGGSVFAYNLTGGSVTTEGLRSHALVAQSIGGGGGSGAEGDFALFANLGGSGAAGGNGGAVTVENDGALRARGDYAHGIFAQSVGGGGGDGASATALVAIGGDGSATSDGGTVTVTNRGSIDTEGDQSHAIFAESVGGGGGDGGRSSGLVSIGGEGASGGNGLAVTVTNEGWLHTLGEESYGMFAQSVGGGGGSGGSAVSVGDGATVSIGGKGGKGGDGDEVAVQLGAASQIGTEGTRAYGVLAQSVGGGGGNGGYAVSAASGGGIHVGVGGRGGDGGDADAVTVLGGGSIDTLGNDAHGIFAQSVGGGGGAGGFSVAGSVGGGIGVNFSLGAQGGGGGIGSIVTVGTDADPILATIHTWGLRAHGIVAQSVGGGGGDGGFAVSGSIGGGGLKANIAIGGNGGSGNTGGAVTVNSAASITTEKADAYGILAQSVGGGGGSGGLTVSADVLSGAGLNFGFGGDGSTGGAGRFVGVGSEAVPTAGTITTRGARAYGILAQSVGGGGGAGGMTTTGSLLSLVTLSFGGAGDGVAGGAGGDVAVYNGSAITTYGMQGHGILAQSVGGGGGAGGLAISGNVTAFGGLTLTMGGDGGSGNTGGTVTVDNSGTILTFDEYAYGIFAQSLGGGGGAGGSSGSVMANFSSLVPVPEPYPTVSVNVAATVGGDGGSGGEAGLVEVANSGRIATAADYSHGVFAQSVGGGGGDGGKGIAVTANISLPSEPSEQISIAVDFAMAVGGDGGSGNHGGAVDIDNTGAIDTEGMGAHGIFAQSVGGGGGVGGDARSMILSIDPSNWSPSDPPPDPTSFSAGATLSIGGKGGAAGDGRRVDVLNGGSIITRGADAYGILAQSIGGGGGTGGGGFHGLDWNDFGVSEAYEPFLDLLPVQDEGDVHINLGGTGGSSGSGGNVSVDSAGFIGTTGAGSVAVFAQSIGGGGGIGGTGATGGDGSVGLGGAGGSAGDGGTVEVAIDGSIETLGAAAFGIVAQSIGGGGGFGANIDRGIDDFGLNFALGASGGSAGNGGLVTIDSAGDIVTRGSGAVGIFAQSVGGGGGLAGEIGFGFGFSGTVGGSGSGGEVSVDHAGDITTFGAAAHGIVAQSAGGSRGTLHTIDYAGLAGPVRVDIDGYVRADGVDADGIVAQSLGGEGNGNVTVAIAGGSVSGGSGSGAGIRILDGAANQVENHGLVRALSGLAISSGGGADRIDNYGTIRGDVVLGAGANAFSNHSGAMLESGARIMLGAGRTLSNFGTVAPGGVGIPATTMLAGDFVQAASGVLALDVSLAGQASDVLAADGGARFAGRISFNPMDSGYALPGTHQHVIVTAAEGITDEGLALESPSSAVLRYALAYPNANAMTVTTSLDFAPTSLSPSARRVADHVIAIQAAGGSAGVAPYVAGLIALPDEAALAAAYEKLGPGALSGLPGAAAGATADFGDGMHSCRQREGASRFAAEGECGWLRAGAGSRDQQRTSRNAGYDLTTHGVAGGVQKSVAADTYLGLGLAYQWSELESRFSQVDGERIEAGLMLKRIDGPTRISASASVGYGSYHSRRIVDLAVPGTVARAEPSLWNVSLLGRVSRDVVRGKDAYLRPMLSIGIARISREGFSETGAGGANLRVRREDDVYATLHPAVEIGREVALDDGTLARPYVRLGLTHHVNGNRRKTTAVMEGAPTGVAPFTSTSESDATYGDVALGVDMLSRSGTVLRIDYSGQFSHSSAANALWVKYAMPF